MLAVSHIQCEYDGHVILEDVSFTVGPGDISCLLGPSGCGKTTALRAIAGFTPLADGAITLSDRLLSAPGFMVAPEQREVGMVFQDFALFPHLTVRENIRFGISRLDRREQNRVTDKLLELVQLAAAAERYPHELSGGQQQRVALARALAPNPKLLLLDEPFSSLDIDLRRRLSLEVREILKAYGISAILVTHDQEEAFAFADHVGLLHQGHLQQWDTPYNLYHEPANRFVADFIGQGSFLPGTVVNQHTVKTELGLIVGNRAYRWPTDTPVDVLIRPDDIVLDREQGLATTVIKKVFSGSATRYQLQLPTGSVVECLFPSHYDYPLGDTLHIGARVEHLIAFPARAHPLGEARPDNGLLTAPAAGNSAAE